MVNTRDEKNAHSPVREKLSDCNTIQYLVEAIRRHDPALIEHGMRTASYSLVLGWLVNLPGNDLKDLYHAGLLHDLGKMSLPKEVILQDGVSIIGEYLMTECTPRAGADMLRPWPALQNVATLIALHHERWDGTGLPCGLRGTQIPLGARILSLADTVDQLLTQKSKLILRSGHSRGSNSSHPFRVPVRSQIGPSVCRVVSRRLLGNVGQLSMDGELSRVVLLSDLHDRYLSLIHI